MITPGMYVKRISPHMDQTPFPYGSVAKVISVGEWVTVEVAGPYERTWPCYPASIQEATGEDVLRYLLAGGWL